MITESQYNCQNNSEEAVKQGAATTAQTTSPATTGAQGEINSFLTDEEWEMCAGGVCTVTWKPVRPAAA